MMDRPIVIVLIVVFMFALIGASVALTYELTGWLDSSSCDATVADYQFDHPELSCPASYHLSCINSSTVVK